MMFSGTSERKRLVCGFALVLGLWTVGGLAGQVDAGQKDFVPDLEKALPQVGEAFDLSLYKSGKALKRWERSQGMREGLPVLETIEPMNHSQAMLKWLAAVSLLESALTVGQSAPESWERALLADYRALDKKEPVFAIFRAVVGVMTVQRGKAMAPLKEYADKLNQLPNYGRDGIRWLAKRRLAGKISTQFRAELLQALVQVHRREGQYQDMHKVAQTLVDQKGSAQAPMALAEALFELNRLSDGDRVLDAFKKKLKGKKSQLQKDGLETAGLRRKLAVVRAKLAKKSTGASWAAKARLLEKLQEPWRIRADLDQAKVISLAHPELDEIYMEALLGDGFDYRAAWRFGQAARGKPSRPGFLGRRVGAGLAMLLEGLFVPSGKPALDQTVVAAVKKDLKSFGSADARLARLTGIYLVFLEALAGGDIYSQVAKMRQPVAAYTKAHPGDLAGVQIAFLVGMLDKGSPSPWSVVKGFRKTLGNKPPPAGFLALYGGAAVRVALAQRKLGPTKEVLAYIERTPDKKRDLEHWLWRAHLKATEALLATGEAQGGLLQQAVDGYGQTIRAWGESTDQSKQPDTLCAAACSLATLLMQGAAVKEAQELIGQVSPVCTSDPQTAAVAAILDLAAGSASEGNTKSDPAAILAQAAQAMPSRQAEIQARLWLGLIAEANGDKEGAARSFGTAAESFDREIARGAPLVLAPDLRALVAQSGQFNMGSGHAPQSPFGLALDITVASKMILFPPAAVSADKLSKYRKKKTK